MKQAAVKNISYAFAKCENMLNNKYKDIHETLYNFYINNSCLWFIGFTSEKDCKVVARIIKNNLKRTSIVLMETSEESNKV